MSEVLISGWRIRALIASVLLGAGGYLAVSLYSGWAAVLHAMRHVGWAVIAAALSMAALNYALRFVRWQRYLAALGHRLPWLAHGRIYLAGFALTTTPGKAGEAVRAVFLKRYGVDYSHSLAALFSERLSDLTAVLLLAAFGLSLYPPARGLVLVAAAAVFLGMVLLSQEGWMRRLAERTAGNDGRLGRLTHHVLRLLMQARRCHGWALLLGATALSLAAWGAEAVAFHWVVQALGLDLSLRFAVFVYAVSMLAGAVSVMPGGLGGAEAAMVALLMFRGAALADAVAATVLIRLATLWFAVLLGMGALLASQRAGDAA